MTWGCTMSRIAAVLAICLLVACGGSPSDEVDVGATTTPDAAAGDIRTTAAPVTGSASEASSTSETRPSDPGSGAADTDCLVGQYELDGADLLKQVSAASSEGGSGQVVSGAMVLDLRADGTLQVDNQAWTFRLSFPDESDTVLGTQTGSITGTWGAVEPADVGSSTGDYWVDLVTDSVTASFVLETASGSIPVPAGDALSATGRFPLLGYCSEPLVIIPLPDTMTGAVIDWTFTRR
jgi:hypothetical protein